MEIGQSGQLGVLVLFLVVVVFKHKQELALIHHLQMVVLIVPGKTPNQLKTQKQDIAIKSHAQ
jgi:hypothetical protein